MVRFAVVLAILAGFLTTSATAAPSRCQRQVLVMAAMPLELNPLVAKASVTSKVRVKGKTFYSGRLAGVDVVMAMTGIGPVNATRTAAAAFEHFRCAFRATVFSGVAGSAAFIGDVMIPQRWTNNDGKSYLAVNPKMYAVARRLPRVPLAADVPVGDAACLCPGVDAATPLHLPHQPQLRVGGTGETSDPFGGSAIPCVPAGGDIAGCEPCVLKGDLAQDTVDFANQAPGFPALLAGVLQPVPATTKTYAAQDEETGAVALVAQRNRVPFLGIRAVSDGQGDPLMLPGFPVQFAVYRQLAGNNAAAVTIAFLNRWARSGRPV
jgi:nucleoside phosphorylase